jgi:hypothetical protein
MDDLRIGYPIKWDPEYRATGTVALWRREYPDLFVPGPLSGRLGTLDLFAQYALQYLLRKRQGVHSLTWYKLASTSPTARNRERTDGHWARMRELMKGDFDTLQRAIIAAGFKDFAGEPDLFCWDQYGRWFFAEAKNRDRLGDKQLRWFQVCKEALRERAEIRVYRLVPER